MKFMTEMKKAVFEEMKRRIQAPKLTGTEKNVGSRYLCGSGMNQDLRSFIGVLESMGEIKNGGGRRTQKSY
jgi:hypothetical protein